MQVCYHESWIKILPKARSKRYSVPKGMRLMLSPYLNGEGNPIPQVRRQCAKCECVLDNIYYEIIQEIRDIKSLQDLDATFAPLGQCCSHIAVKVSAWRASVEEEIRQVKPFLDYL